MPVESPSALRDIFETDEIVVIGASTTPGKAAHDVPAYLQRQGYEIVPVNPFADEVLGEESFDSLGEVSGPISVVDVFRPSEEVNGIVNAAIDRGDVAVIWLQLGIHDDEAVSRAEDAGIDVVQDRCMKVEHESLFG